MGAIAPSSFLGKSAGVVLLAEGAGHGVLVLGDDDEVDVVGHETPTEDGEAVVGGLLAEEVEVEEPIGVGMRYSQDHTQDNTRSTCYFRPS